MGTPATRLYSIEVKDAETGDTLIFTAVDWTAEEKRLAVALIGRLTALHGARLRPERDDDSEPKPDKGRYH